MTKKVKAYGILPVSQRQYIIIQTIVFAILIISFIFASLVNLDEYVFGNARLVIIIVTILEIIETYFILKKFR